MIRFFKSAILLSLIPSLSIGTTWDKGFNFRATSGYVTDGTNETYSIGEGTPQTRNGVTFQWAASNIGQTRDRDNSAAPQSPHFSGINFAGNAAGATPQIFQITLPATGLYFITVAAGDASNAQAIDMEFGDNTTYTTVANGVATGSANVFVDAVGVTRSSPTNWNSNILFLAKNFTTTTFNVRLGGLASVGNSSTIAYMRIVQADQVIGYSTNGTTKDDTDKFANANEFAAPSSGNASSGIGCYGGSTDSGTAQVYVAAYDDGDANISGNNLLATSGPITLTTTKQIVCAPITWTGIVSGTTYFLEDYSNTTGVNTYFDAGLTDQFTNTSTNPTPLNPHATRSGTQAAKMTVFVNYTQTVSSVSGLLRGTAINGGSLRLTGGGLNLQ